MAGSGSLQAEAAAAWAPVVWWQRAGKAYPKKEGTSGVNSRWAVEDVHEYCEACRGFAPQCNPEEEMRYESVDDYAQALRNGARMPDSPFLWPSTSSRVFWELWQLLSTICHHGAWR